MRITRREALAGVSVTAATITATINATSGTLSGLSVTGDVTAGNVTLNSSGLELVAGDTSSSSVRWSDGSYIRSYTSGTVRINANTELGIITSSNLWKIENGAFFSATAGDLGKTGNPFANAYIDGGTVRLGGIGADTGTALVLNGSSLVKTDSSSIRYKRNIRKWQPRF